MALSKEKIIIQVAINRRQKEAINAIQSLYKKATGESISVSEVGAMLIHTGLIQFSGDIAAATLSQESQDNQKEEIN